MFRKMSLIVGVISVCLMLSTAGERFTASANGPAPWCDCGSLGSPDLVANCCHSWCGTPGDPNFPADAVCSDECFNGSGTCSLYN
jgi:hypothetical protein